MGVFDLERTGDVDELRRLLLESDSPAVRQRAAEALGSLNETDSAVIEVLVEAARDDPAEAVRVAAIDAVDQLGADAVERLLAGLIDVETASRTGGAFVEALDEELPELRMAAANALGRSGGIDAVEPLVARLDDPDPRVRARIVRACGRIGDPRALPGLAKATADRHPAVRREAAGALGDIGGNDALAALIELLDDEHDSVRRVAVSSLGEFESLDPVEPLVSSLEDSNAQVRRTAVFSVIQLLSNAPEGHSHEMRETVVAALEASDDRSVTQPLVDVLQEGKQADQRRNSAWLLGHVTGTNANGPVVDALTDALGDEDEAVSRFAAMSLASIGGEAVETSLIDVLDDEAGSSNALPMAVFALGKVGGDRARERIEALLQQSDDEQVRKRAFGALSKLGAGQGP